MVACPSCGERNRAGQRFCGSCGRPLATADVRHEERKRISVLFCDLVGFTSQAETMDPEDVRALLQPYHARVRAELERHGGTVEKFIGDAVVALFGAPTGHEDDPERAVRAALAIRDRVAGDRLHVRIGVTTGEALVVVDARPDLGEGMASGDVVNTAARLQAAAPVDGILVDEATHRAAGRGIAFRDHPEVDAKGKSSPVPVWEVVGARSRLGLDVAEAAPTPLVGRRHELDVLVNALARARETTSAQLVTLVGVPGMGKSRLVLELFRRVEADADLIRWRQGRCLSYGETMTLWALGEIVKAEAGILETDSQADAEAKLDGTVAELLGPNELAWVARHLRPLVGLETAGEIEGGQRDEAFAAWRRFFEATAERGPVVLVFEDLQWADDTLLDFVDELVEWTADVPLLVVATARPELLSRRPSWSGGKSNATVLSLAPLSDEETARLAYTILGRSGEPPDATRSLVVAAGGNPLYAEEYARMVSELGPEAATENLPDTVQGIIGARLDALAPADKAVLQDAAVIGKVFWLSGLQALTGEERWELERRLHDLERRELLRRDRQSTVAGERQYAFRHLLVRDVAYGQIPRARRAAKHAAAAEWIESLAPDRSEDRASMLAEHWSDALTYAQASGQDATAIRARARSALVDAGNHALALNAAGDAARYFERALAIEADPAVQFRFARSLYLGTDPRAAAVLEEARSDAARRDDRETEAFAEGMLADLAYDAGEMPEANRRLERSTALVDGLPSSEAKGWVLSRAAARTRNAGRIDESIEHAEAALAIADELDLDDLRIHALGTLGGGRADRGELDGIADMERALGLATARGSREATRTAHNLGVQWFLRGDLVRMARYGSEATDFAIRFGDGRLLRWIRGTSTSVHYMLGDWDAAIEATDEYLARGAGEEGYHIPFVRSFRAVIRLARDDVAGALDDVEHALAAVDDSLDPQAQAPPLGLGSVVLMELGDPRGPAVALRAADLRIGYDPEMMTISHLPLLPLPRDVAARIRRAVTEARVETRWTAAGTAALDGRFGDAVEIFSSMPLRPVEARARMRYAEQLAHEGRRGEADAEIERALAFWRSVGATRYVRTAEAQRSAVAVPQDARTADAR